MRGTRFCYRVCFLTSWFIPAYAGNADASIPTTRLLSVHPRICGERHLVFIALLRGVGSSPHMRGTLPEIQFSMLLIRFIPAYAGNAQQEPKESRSTPVHPRICGERTIARAPGRKGDGSSPHMRGTLPVWATASDSKRFIPAYAGNADGIRGIRGGHSVHPRICGERQNGMSSSLAPPGSSPHMRGTLWTPSKNGRAGRFIPAYAGNAPAAG